MFIKFFLILLIVFFVLVAFLVIGTGEQFAEKLLPAVMVGGVIAYLVLSWYLGHFIGKEKPPIELVSLAIAAIVIAFFSGYFMSRE